MTFDVILVTLSQLCHRKTSQNFSILGLSQSKFLAMPMGGLASIFCWSRGIWGGRAFANEVAKLLLILCFKELFRQVFTVSFLMVW